MRSTAINTLLFIAATAILLAAPPAATRSLNQEPAGAPTDSVSDTAASSTDPTQTTPPPEINVDVDVTLKTANCSVVQKKVDTTISAWIKRVAVLVQVTKDPATCTADGGVAVVSVKAKVTVPSLGGVPIDTHTIISQIKQAIGPTNNLTKLANKIKEFKNLVNWAKAKKIKVTKVVVNVTA